MKFNIRIVLCCAAIVSCFGLNAWFLDEAIRKSDVKVVKEWLALQELSSEEKASYVFLAKEVLHNRKDALQKRRTRVITSTVLKLLPIPFTYPITLPIARLLDSRGLGLLFGIPCACAALVLPFDAIIIELHTA